MMTISQNGGPFRVPPDLILASQHQDQYTFHPQFLPEESSALRALSREMADAYVNILASKGIDAEVVETQ
jgi:hypothetical protein